jgi:hypothetical protein
VDLCVPGSEMLFPWTRCGVASWAVDCATLPPDTFPILCSLPFPLYTPYPLATANIFAQPSIPAPLAPVLNDTLVHLMTLRFGDLQWKVHTAAFLLCVLRGGNGEYHGTRVPGMEQQLVVADGQEEHAGLRPRTDGPTCHRDDPLDDWYGKSWEGIYVDAEVSAGQGWRCAGGLWPFFALSGLDRFGAVGGSWGRPPCPALAFTITAPKTRAWPLGFRYTCICMRAGCACTPGDASGRARGSWEGRGACVAQALLAKRLQRSTPLNRHLPPSLPGLRSAAFLPPPPPSLLLPPAHVETVFGAVYGSWALAPPVSTAG